MSAQYFLYDYDQARPKAKHTEYQFTKTGLHS